MSQERQKLSFCLVIIFLAIFGVIVLAEVLFVEDGRNRGEAGEFLYDEMVWETPKPLPLLKARGGFVTHHQQPKDLYRHGSHSRDMPRNERFQKSLQEHQAEMETLIRNISSRIHSSMAPAVAAVAAAVAPKPKTALPINRPYNYSAHDPPLHLNFDFSLESHQGFDAQWQPVEGTFHKFYVYSAYYDARIEAKHVVRIIGATKTKQPDRVWCQFHYRDSDRAQRTKVSHPASISVIRENWNLKYSACFVLCPIPLADKAPESVSVISNAFKSKQDDDHGGLKPTPSNQLPVHNFQTGTGNETPNNLNEIGVCVKPVHFQYDQVLELAEFIELNRLLGVTKFTIYNDTMSPRVDCLLRHYQELGAVEVLPWKLNIKSQSEIRTEGLFAALNDCLYRNMNRFHYLMLIDFDEYIIPHQNRTLPKMLEFINSQRRTGVITATGGGTGSALLSQKSASKLKIAQRLTSAYSFQNSFFYLQFPDDIEMGLEVSRDHVLPLRTLLKTRRKSKFNPQKQRSKYICIPRNVREAGNHFIWEFMDGYNVNVPVHVGFLHHYRVCEFGGNDCIHTDSKVDKTIVNHYQPDLIGRVQDTLTGLADTCGWHLSDWLRPIPTNTTSSPSTLTRTDPTIGVEAPKFRTLGQLTARRPQGKRSHGSTSRIKS
eukprot:snap_masked-scaffold1459_size40432-processed-gene-0.3 protein:Tk02619 transcript:snap_masked-scaffold1459_size40432-processed-gene-0.3-mRNA-1 annotation:"PREDICTED: uncharacterized protein LOC656883"